MKIEVQRFLALSGIDSTQWNDGFESCVHFNYDNLKVVEEAKINDIFNTYLGYYSDNEIIAKSNLYVIDTDFSTMDNNLKAVLPIIKKWYPDFMKFKTLECSSFSGIGEGTILKNAEHFPYVLPLLVKEMDAIAREKNAEIQIIRDIPLKNYDKYKKILIPLGFYPAPGFSDTEIDISRWKKLDDYLQDLKKRIRTPLKKYLRHLKEVHNVDYEFCRDYGQYAPVLAALWKNVNKEATDYQREFLNEAYFSCSAQYLKDASEVILFKKEGRIICFMLSLFDDKTYYALNFGIDYSVPNYKDMNLYRVSLMLRIQRAADMNKKHFNLGITNYDLKMDMGAEVIPLVYFVKHTKSDSYSRALAKTLYDNIKHPDTQMHKPFKDYEVNTLDYPLYLLNIKADQNTMPDDDIFQKVVKYHRISNVRLANIYFFYPEFKSAQESSISMDNKDRVVLLGTNSYLGAATFPQVKEAAIKAIEKYGTGCSGSPLLNGTLDIHKQLEEELAQFYGREAALLCSTGYQTNMAGIAALAGTGDVLIYDERNHRSLFDAAKFSGAYYYVYKHNNMEHLELILSKLGGKKKLIVSDSVFSMEGIKANLVKICELAMKYGARVFIDEAHGVGVFGDKGRGVCELDGVEDKVDIIMGTFSKSFASIGGFLTGKKNVIDFIKHTASPHIFSASLPPASIASVSAVLKIIAAQPELRKKPLANAKFMADALQEMGYRASFKGTQIVPVIFGNETLAMVACKRFMEHNVYVNPVLPPAVPEQDAGFRTSYIATHKQEDLEYALSVFKNHRDDFLLKRPDKKQK